MQFYLGVYVFPPTFSARPGDETDIGSEKFSEVQK